MPKRNGCRGKKQFPTKEAACVALRRRFGKHCAMNVYRCSDGHWHLGRTNDPCRLANRVTQVLEKHERALKRRLAQPTQTPPISERGGSEP